MQSTQPPAQGARAFVQFVMAYQHSSGQKRIRVTTTSRNWVDMQQQQAQVRVLFDVNIVFFAMQGMQKGIRFHIQVYLR